MLFTILMSAQILICLTMGGLILMQQSEGGALGMGGGPSGFMSARGAGNLLTRATGFLAFLFFAVSISLTIVGNIDHRKVSAVDKVDTSSLVLTPQTAAPAAAASQGSSSAPPSLSDLPLASTPTAAPSQQQTQPSAPTQSRPVAVPPPLKLPTTGGASTKDVEKAKASIWQGASSSAPGSASSSSKP